MYRYSIYFYSIDQHILLTLSIHIFLGANVEYNGVSFCTRIFLVTLPVPLDTSPAFYQRHKQKNTKQTTPSWENFTISTHNFSSYTKLQNFFSKQSKIIASQMIFSGEVVLENTLNKIISVSLIFFPSYSIFHFQWENLNIFLVPLCSINIVLINISVL